MCNIPECQFRRVMALCTEHLFINNNLLLIVGEPWVVVITELMWNISTFWNTCRNRERNSLRGKLEQGANFKWGTKEEQQNPWILNPKNNVFFPLSYCVPNYSCCSSGCNLFYSIATVWMVKQIPIKHAWAGEWALILFFFSSSKASIYKSAHFFWMPYLLDLQFIELCSWIVMFSPVLRYAFS